MKRQQRILATQTGFTLIEVMVVVIILGTLAALIIPKLMDRPDAARVTKAQADIRAIESALGLYRLDNHRYPLTGEGLAALVDKPENAPKWKEGGYLERLPIDPWGSPYQYVSPGEQSTIDVFSFGADGTSGGEGINTDIGNWDL